MTSVVVSGWRRLGAGLLLLVALVLIAGGLAGRGSIGAHAAGVATAAAPLALLALFAVPIEALMVALVVACQVTAATIGIGERQLFLEHVLVLATFSALFLRLRHSIVRKPRRHEILLLVWIAWNALVSLLFSEKVADSLAIIVWMGLAWLILWVCTGYFLVEASGASRIMRIGSGVAAFLGGLSFVFWIGALSGLMHVGVQPDFYTDTVAAKGAALEPNLLGSQCLFWFFWIARQRVLKDVPLPPWQLLGLVLGIVSSMTRAVWLATILVGAAMVTARMITTRIEGDRRERTGTGRRSAAVVGVSAILVVSLMGAPPARKFAASFDFRSSTGAARVRNWGTAWQEITRSRSYLFGLGTNSYGQRHSSRTLRGEPDYLGNLGLTLLYDSGVVGAALFLAAMGGLVLRPKSLPARVTDGTFVAALLVVGTATNPIWFGFPWVIAAAMEPRTGGPDPESGERVVQRPQPSPAVSRDVGRDGQRSGDATDDVPPWTGMPQDGPG